MVPCLGCCKSLLLLYSLLLQHTHQSFSPCLTMPGMFWDLLWNRKNVAKRRSKSDQRERRGISLFTEPKLASSWVHFLVHQKSAPIQARGKAEKLPKVMGKGGGHPIKWAKSHVTHMRALFSGDEVSYKVTKSDAGRGIDLFSYPKVTYEQQPFIGNLQTVTL